MMRSIAILFTGVLIALAAITLSHHDEIFNMKLEVLKQRYSVAANQVVHHEKLEALQREFETPGLNASQQEIVAFAFRSKAAKAIKKLDKALSHLGQPVKKKLVKAKGGCS